MNIFENYLDKLIQTIKLEAKENNLILPDNLSSINVDVPPINFDYDISTNIAMVLSKPNKKSPLKLGETFINLIKKNNRLPETYTPKSWGPTSSFDLLKRHGFEWCEPHY